MKTFFLVLFHPIKTFGKLGTDCKFSKMSLFILLFLIFTNLILMIPVSEKIVSITISSMDIVESQQDTIMQITHKMRYLQAIGTLFYYLFTLLFYALILWVLIPIARNKLSFKNALQLIVYCYFIVVIGDFINTILLYTRGLDSIKNVYDISLVGLNMLTSVERVGAIFYVFLSCFTPFQLLFIFLLSIGLKVFTNMKYILIYAIVTIFWLVTTLIPVISVYLSELSASRPSII